MIPNFAFVLEGKLAGCAHPGRSLFLRETLMELTRDHRVTALVSLTEEPIEKSVLEEYGLAWLHVPVNDFSVPSIPETARVVRFVHGEIGRGGCVAIHCRAGYGRTGTLLACCLVAEGLKPKEAMERVRAARPGSIETGGQEAFVREWAAWYRENQSAIKNDSPETDKEDEQE